MPQIDQIAATYASQIFWLLLTFGLTFFVIGIGMFPKVQGTVDAREKRIADDLEAAREANNKADELEENYRQRMASERDAAQSIVTEAKASAAKEAEAKTNAADAEANAKIAEAETAIAAKSAEAMQAIEDVAAEAAQDMVTKLSGIEVSKDAALAEVKAALNG